MKTLENIFSFPSNKNFGKARFNEYLLPNSFLSMAKELRFAVFPLRLDGRIILLESLSSGKIFYQKGF